MGVLPTHTIFGFLGSRFLVMALPPDCTLGVRRGLRALPGALFILLLFLLDAFFFVGHCCIGDNADTWRQSLLLAFFLALLDIDIHVVRVSPPFFIGAFLLPETTFVDAFQIDRLKEAASDGPLAHRPRNS